MPSTSSSSARRQSSLRSQGPGPAACGVPSGGGVSSAAGAWAPRVSRRAVGISSVFLQGLRSSAGAAAGGAPGAVGPPGGPGGACGGGLDGRLLEYRDKVRELERLNRSLEEQIRQNLDRRASRAGARGSLRGEWEELYQQVSEGVLSNARVSLEAESVRGRADDLKDRYLAEQPLRSALQEEEASLRRVLEEARAAEEELQEQKEQLGAELRHLEESYRQDLRGLCRHLSGHQVDEPDTPMDTEPDQGLDQILDQVLDQVRTQWEAAMERTRADGEVEAEAAALGRSGPEEQQLEALRTEVSEAGGRIQRLQAETESTKALNRGLESSLGDARHWQQLERQNLQQVLSRMEAELGQVRGEEQQQRRDHGALLSNRQRLQQQVRLYHQILGPEEEEERCSARRAEPERAEPKKEEAGAKGSAGGSD